MCVNLLKILVIGYFVLIHSNCKEKIGDTTINVERYESTDDCHNKISIILENDKQFRATITSDIPIYQGVEFAGYYEKGKSFLMLRGLFGDPIALKVENDYFIMTDVPEEQAIHSGWKLRIKVQREQH